MSPIIFETTLGQVPVEWERKGGIIDVGVNQFLPKTLGKAPTTEEVCRALRISEEELTGGPIQSVATSRFKLIVPLKNQTILDNLDPDFEYLWELCDKYETTGFYPYALEREENGEFMISKAGWLQ